MQRSRNMRVLAEMAVLRDLQVAAAQAEAGRTAAEVRTLTDRRDTAIEERAAIEEGWNGLLTGDRLEPDASQRWARSWRDQDARVRQDELDLAMASQEDADRRAEWGAATHNRDAARQQHDRASRTLRRLRDEARVHEAAERVPRGEEEA
jgi:hypothetical protein